MNKETSPSIDDLKALAIHNIQQLKKRGYSFPTFNNFAKQAGLDSSNGFDSICAKVKKLEKGDVHKTIQDILKVSKDELYKHTALANKRIYIFKLEKENLIEIRNNFKKDKYFCDDFKKGKDSYFDYDVNINTHLQSSLKLNVSPTLDIFYLKHVRSFFDKSSVPNLIDEIENTDENSQVIDVVKIVRHTVCVFDFIAIDLKHNCLIMGLDLTEKFINSAMNKTYGQLKDLFQSLFGLAHFSPLNLLPCVKKMEDESLGNVVKHYFATEDGAYNYTAGSSTVRKDARKDGFFFFFLKDLDADFYGISKRYPFATDNPIITIKMGLGEYKKSAFSPINFAIIDHMTLVESLQPCIDKIMEHLISD